MLIQWCFVCQYFGIPTLDNHLCLVSVFTNFLSWYNFTKGLTLGLTKYGCHFWGKGSRWTGQLSFSKYMDWTIVILVQIKPLCDGKSSSQFWSLVFVSGSIQWCVLGVCRVVMGVEDSEGAILPAFTEGLCLGVTKGLAFEQKVKCV